MYVTSNLEGANGLAMGLAPITYFPTELPYNTVTDKRIHIKDKGSLLPTNDGTNWTKKLNRNDLIHEDLSIYPKLTTVIAGPPILTSTKIQYEDSTRNLRFLNRDRNCNFSFLKKKKKIYINILRRVH